MLLGTEAYKLHLSFMKLMRLLPLDMHVVCGICNQCRMHAPKCGRAELAETTLMAPCKRESSARIRYDMGYEYFVQSVASSLNGVNSSLSTVPDLTTYIASLTPAVAAYTALGPTIITDMQTQITSINSTITSVIASPLHDQSRHTVNHVHSCKSEAAQQH